MKRLSILIFILVAMVSCKKDNNTSQQIWYTCSFFYHSGTPHPVSPIHSDTSFCGVPGLYVLDINGVQLNYTCTPH